MPISLYTPTPPRETKPHRSHRTTHLHARQLRGEGARRKKVEEMAAAGSSKFTVTCGLLRQYMREHQQQQGAAFRPPAVSLLPPSAPEAAEETDARTMQLFPPHAGTSSQPSQERPEAQTTAPLTIFYDGRVLVFEDFPAEKAKELMQLAGSESSPAEKVAPAVPQKPAAAQPAGLSDMPIARKASLQRFLQKRKHRITTSDPYQKVAASPAEKDVVVVIKPVKDEPAPWLGL